jgi:hypothetical protein
VHSGAVTVELILATRRWFMTLIYGTVDAWRGYRVVSLR